MSKTNVGCVGCSVISAGLAMFLFVIGISSISIFDANETTCNVVDVTYPTVIPNSIEEVDSNFVPCDCGRRCVSDMGYCISIYVNVNNKTKLALDTVANNPSEDKCTFREKACKKGEEVSDRIEMLKTVHNKVQPYIEHMNTNQPIKCYTHNGNVFLDNDITNTILLLVVLGILFVICILISLFCCGCFEIICKDSASSSGQSSVEPAYII